MSSRDLAHHGPVWRCPHGTFVSPPVDRMHARCPECTLDYWRALRRAMGPERRAQMRAHGLRMRRSGDCPRHGWRGSLDYCGACEAEIGREGLEDVLSPD